MPKTRDMSVKVIQDLKTYMFDNFISKGTNASVLKEYIKLLCDDVFVHEVYISDQVLEADTIRQLLTSKNYVALLLLDFVEGQNSGDGHWILLYASPISRRMSQYYTTDKHWKYFSSAAPNFVFEHFQMSKIIKEQLHDIVDISLTASFQYSFSALCGLYCVSVISDDYLLSKLEPVSRNTTEQLVNDFLVLRRYTELYIDILSTQLPVDQVMLLHHVSPTLIMNFYEYMLKKYVNKS